MRFTRISPLTPVVREEPPDPDADLDKRRRRMLILLVSIIALIAFFSFSWISQVSGYAVVMGIEVSMRAAIDGQVNWHVPQGTRIKKGDVIVKLDSTISTLRLKEAEADLNAIVAQYKLEKRKMEREMAKLKTDEEEARIDLLHASEKRSLDKTNLEYNKYLDDTTNSLYSHDLVSEREQKERNKNHRLTRIALEKSEQELKARRQQLHGIQNAVTVQNQVITERKRLFEARIAALKTKKQRLKKDVESAHQRSPINGIVLNVLTPSGTFCRTGDVVLTLIDDSDLSVAIYVPEEHLTNTSLSMNKDVRIRFNAYPLRTVSGKVVERYSRLSSRPATTPYGVEPYPITKEGFILVSRVRLSKSIPFDIQPGMTGTVLLSRRGPLWILRSIYRILSIVLGL